MYEYIRTCSFLLSLDCFTIYPSGEVKYEPVVAFYYLLIASEIPELRGRLDLLLSFLLSLDCFRAIYRSDLGSYEEVSFYYLLIASVVCSSQTLLYGFPRLVSSLSLDVEHDLSVSV